MTKLIPNTITEAYKEVFHHTNKEEDTVRISLLEQAVEGLAFKPDQNTAKLEEALAEAEKVNPEGMETREYRALTVLRDWYRNPEGASKENIVEKLTEAGMNCILNTLPSCLEVLKAHRIKTLKTAFYKAFNLKDAVRKGEKGTYSLREQAILATAEVLCSSGIPELREYAVEHMSKYQKDKNYKPR